MTRETQNRLSLVFDVGNTAIKWGVVEGGSLAESRAVSHVELRDGGFELLLRELPKDVEAAIASNVAGEDFGKQLARAVGLHIGGDLCFVRSEASAFGITSSYAEPRSP